MDERSQACRREMVPLTIGRARSAVEAMKTAARSELEGIPEDCVNAALGDPRIYLRAKEFRKFVESLEHFSGGISW